MVYGFGIWAAAAGMADDGSDRVYVATCREGRAELVASVGPDGVQTELGGAYDAPDPALLALGERLSRAVWYRHHAPVADPFAPFVRSSWNDGGSTAVREAPCRDLCGDQVLVLGQCPVGTDGGLFTTAPSRPMPTLALSVREHRRLRDDGAGVQEVVILRDGAGAERPVFDGADGVLASGPTVWVALDGLGAVGLIPGVSPDQSAYTAVVAVAPDGAVTAATALIDGEGC